MSPTSETDDRAYLVDCVLNFAEDFIHPSRLGMYREALLTYLFFSNEESLDDLQQLVMRYDEENIEEYTDSFSDTIVGYLTEILTAHGVSVTENTPIHVLLPLVTTLKLIQEVALTEAFCDIIEANADDHEMALIELCVMLTGCEASSLDMYVRDVEPALLETITNLSNQYAVSVTPVDKERVLAIRKFRVFSKTEILPGYVIAASGIPLGGDLDIYLPAIQELVEASIGAMDWVAVADGLYSLSLISEMPKTDVAETLVSTLDIYAIPAKDRSVIKSNINRLIIDFGEFKESDSATNDVSKPSVS